MLHVLSEPSFVLKGIVMKNSSFAVSGCSLFAMSIMWLIGPHDEREAPMILRPAVTSLRFVTQDQPELQRVSVEVSPKTLPEQAIHFSFNSDTVTLAPRLNLRGECERIALQSKEKEGSTIQFYWVTENTPGCWRMVTYEGEGIQDSVIKEASALQAVIDEL